MAKARIDPPKGLLNRSVDTQKFQLARYLPSPDLAFFVEHYWIVQWDLRGQDPYVSENLPYPSVHLVFQPNETRIVGVIRGKFVQRLENYGHVLGIKFRPGAFYPFIHSPVANFTDSSLSLETVFGVETKRLEDAVLSLDDHGAMVECAETFLRPHLPEPDETVETVNQIIDTIITQRSITKVDDLVHRLPMNKRTLQRLFHQYVGVSPKWVIKRYRLHEAVEQLAGDNLGDCAEMALKLGYFDQAHFIKDFKSSVGRPPAEYARDSAFKRIDC